MLAHREQNHLLTFYLYTYIVYTTFSILTLRFQKNKKKLHFTF